MAARTPSDTGNTAPARAAMLPDTISQATSEKSPVPLKEKRVSTEILAVGKYSFSPVPEGIAGRTRGVTAKQVIDICPDIPYHPAFSP